MSFNNFAEFWPFYLKQHQKASTRKWHFVGTSCVVLCIIATIVTTTWWLILLAPIVGYGFAWYSHFFIEGNKPATFGHPFWSLRADFKMFFLTLFGKLNQELKRLDDEKKSSIQS